MWTPACSQLCTCSQLPPSVCCLGGALSDSGLHSRRVLFLVGNRSFCLWRQAIINSWEEGRVFTLSKLHDLQPPLGGDNISHIPNKWVAVGRGKLNGWRGGAWTVHSDPSMNALCFPLKFLSYLDTLVSWPTYGCVLQFLSLSYHEDVQTCTNSS